jgi:ribulose 1,5-bisphosphate carboxylase large subunit-like protein
MMCSVLTLSIGNNQRMVAPSLARSSSRSRVCSQSLFGKVCEALWQAGDFIKDDEPQDNRVICQMNDSIPEVIEAMRACVKEDRCIQDFLC